jgi:hypothetical protein
MDDYWGDDSQYDSEIEALKDSLKSSVKAEIKKELETLRKDNRDLKVKLDNLDSLEKQAQSKARELERAIENAERSAKRKRAKELFAEIATEKYLVTSESYFEEKCGKCNDERKLVFTYPSGKEGLEVCNTCGYQQYRRVVTEAIGTSVDIRDGELMVWYKPFSKNDDDYHSMSGTIYKKYTGQPYEDKIYSYLFETREDAQGYADFINEKDATKDKEIG